MKKIESIHNKTKQNEELPYNTNNILLSENPFIDCKAISVDYAIMEKLCNDDDTEIQKKTLLYNSSWSDIGSFMALYEESEKDENSNVTKGDVITIDTNNCFYEIFFGNLIFLVFRESLCQWTKHRHWHH